MTALVGAFNQEKALVGAFSVIVKTGCGTDGANTALVQSVVSGLRGDQCWDHGLASGDPGTLQRRRVVT